MVPQNALCTSVYVYPQGHPQRSGLSPHDDPQSEMLAIHSRYICVTHNACWSQETNLASFCQADFYSSKSSSEGPFQITMLIFRFSGKSVRSTHQVTRAQLPACDLGPCSLTCKGSSLPGPDSPGSAGEEDRAMAPTGLAKLSPGNYKDPIYSLAVTDSLQEFNTPSIKNVLA